MSSLSAMPTRSATFADDQVELTLCGIADLCNPNEARCRDAGNEAAEETDGLTYEQLAAPERRGRRHHKKLMRTCLSHVPAPQSEA